MNQNRLSIVILTILLFYNEMAMSTVLTLIHDLVQYNIAGVPVVHQKTEWDFDPQIGKQRRARYKQENGHLGEIAIAKVGMGIAHRGTPTQKR